MSPLANYDIKFEPAFEEITGIAVMQVKTLYYKKAGLNQRMVFGCGNDTTLCSQKKNFNLIMLDGRHSDNFDVLTFNDQKYGAHFFDFKNVTDIKNITGTFLKSKV